MDAKSDASRTGCECVVDGVDLPALPDPADWEVRRRRASWRRAAATSRGPTTLVLDIGGVLVPSLFESVRASATDRPFPRGPLADDPTFARVDAGELGEREYWQLVADEGWDVERLWRTCSSIRSLLWEALVAIGLRMRVIAFTNDMAHWFGPDWLQRFPMLGQLDAVVEASKLGVLKPDPEAYRRALEIIDEPSEQCLMVDDLRANVAGAEAAGMRGLHFDVADPQGSVRALRRALAMSEHDRPTVFRLFGS